VNRREALAAALILALALLAAFGPDIVSGRFLFLRVIEDPNNLFSFYPWDIFSARLFREGRFPLYNPFNACGAPHLANFQGAPLFPLHLLLFLHPTRLAFDLFLILRIFILGFGTFCLARRLGLSKMAAYGAMLAAAFNGFFMHYQAMAHLNVETLIPWAMLSALCLHVRRRFRDWAMLAAITACALLGGSAESAFLLIIFTLAWSVWLNIFLSRGNAAFPAVSGINGNFLSNILLAVSAIVAAGLISTAQLLPFLEYLPHAWHIHPEGAGAQWLDARGIVTLAAPQLFRAQVGFAPCVGAVVLMLAVIGSGRDRKTWFFFVIALFLFALIYGPPGTKWLVRLPGFNRAASYKYGLAPLGVALAILAGRGIESLIVGEATAGRARRAALAIAVFIAFFVMGGWITGHDMKLSSAAAALIALGMAAAAASIPMSRKSAWLKAPALVAILWIELMAHFYGLAPHSQLDPNQLKNSPQIAYLMKESKMGRLAASLDTGILPNLNLLWGINDVGLFDALYPKAYVKLMGDALGFKPSEATTYFKTHAYSFPISPSGIGSRIWRDLGVRFYLGRDIYRSGMIMAAQYLWEDYSSVPLMGMSEKTEPLKWPSDETALEPIIADEWRHNFSAGQAQHTIIARYNYLPGWRAWLDGKEIRLVRAGEMFFSLEIPREGGEIRMRYVPWGWKIGLWAALAATIILTALISGNILNRKEYR